MASADDFRSQLEQIKKMGPIGQLLQMVPGAGQMAGAAQAAVDSGDMKLMTLDQYTEFLKGL